MEVINTDNRYKPQPVWLWNSKLNIESTSSAADKIISSGSGGFAVCPFHGLKTGYLGDEWFRNVSAALSYAADTSAEGWFFDKATGTCGYSCSEAHKKGLEYQQKFLRCEPGEKTNERTIIFSNGYHFYYDVNPFSLDVLHPSSSEIFINEYYTGYSQLPITGLLLGTSIISPDSIPWSFSLPAEYKTVYGEELLDVLEELFRPVGKYKETRLRFWTLVINLYKNNFINPIYRWCKENNLKFSVISENSTPSDSFSKANAMSLFEYCDIPCVEAKSYEDISPVKALMASSVMHQYGKEQSSVLLYASCGHNYSFDDLRYIAEEYLIRGVNKIMPFAVPYSLSGFRKTTVSTSFIGNSSDKSDILKFNAYLSGISKLITEGTAEFNTLLIHNQADALRYYDATASDETFLIESRLSDTIKTLEKKHIPFHIADELMLERDARVEDNVLILGNQKYSTIVLTESPDILESTATLLSEFEMSGGFIVMAENLADNPICNSEKLLYTTRSFPEYKIHYFLNSSNEYFTASISQGNKILNPISGETIPFFGIYRFSPRESLIIIDDSTPQISRPYSKPLKVLDTGGIWQIVEHSFNTLVVDKCDVYINDIKVNENISAYDVSEVISKTPPLSRVECLYKFNVIKLQNDIFISNDNFENFTVKINGIEIPYNKDTRLENIAQFINEGENFISFFTKVSANDKLRSHYEKALVYETEASLFSYEKDFAPIYISGNFGVHTTGDFRRLDKNASRYIGAFAIDDNPAECDISSIEKCGFPFFGGSITLKKKFNLSDTSYCIRLNPKAVRSITLEVNSKTVDTTLWAPFEWDLSEYLAKGDNEIQITINSTLRNLLGPHHMPLGELDTVNVSNYYRYRSIWNKETSPPWQDDYCFSEFGFDVTE